MCMHTNQLEPKIAEKNILVLKYTCLHLNDVFSFTSLWQNFKYERFKRYFQEIYKIGEDSAFRIEVGFHSYINLKQGEDGWAYFIIPKGAKYYEGGDNCSPNFEGCTVRVSNQIIHIGRKNKFTRLIAKIFYGV